MTAIDMNTGEHLWMRPMGDGDRIRNLPLLRHLDLPPLGGDSGRVGPVLTKTLLIYALTTGGADDRPRLVAFDKMTGEEIASVDLPGGAIGTPMTYLSGGRQYIALTVGGGRVPASSSPWPCRRASRTVDAGDPATSSAAASGRSRAGASEGGRSPHGTPSRGAAASSGRMARRDRAAADSASASS